MTIADVTSCHLLSRTLSCIEEDKEGNWQETPKALQLFLKADQAFLQRVQEKKSIANKKKYFLWE